MKYLLGLILLVSVSASAQYSPTAAKTRFVNGIGLGTKDTLTMNAADTVAMIVGRDSLVYFRYKGYWKPLAYNSSLTGYVPYTGATGSVNLGSYNLTANKIAIGGSISAVALDVHRAGSIVARIENINSSQDALFAYAQSAQNVWFTGIDYASGANNFGFYYSPDGTTVIRKAYFSNSGDLTAASFIKSGGTSSQFLKADGSVTTIIPSGSIDTGRAVTAIATGGSLNKVRDSLQANIGLKLNISDTATMLSGYKTYYPRAALSAGTGITYNASTGVITNSSPSTGGTVTSVATNTGSGITGGTITTSGTIAADTSVLATRLRVQKGIDSLGAAKIGGSGDGNYVAKFTGLGVTIGNSTMQDDGSKVTASGDLEVGYHIKAGISIQSEAYQNLAGGTALSLSSGVGIPRVLVGVPTDDNTNELQVQGGTRITGQLKLGSTITNGTYTYTLPSATGTLALVGGSGVGTVTSVATDATMTGGTITTSGTLKVDTSVMATRLRVQKGIDSLGAAKQGNITLTTTGTSGAATFSSNTLNIPQYQAAGTYVTSVTGTSPIVSSGGTTPAISIPAATTSINGYLTSTDWNTFNGKQNALTNPVTGTGTTNYLPKFTGTSTIGNSGLSDDGQTLKYTASSTYNTIFSLYSAAGAGGVDVRNWGLQQNFTVYGDFAIMQSATKDGIPSSGTAKIYIDNIGRVGIANTSPSYVLDVSGTGRFTGALTGTSATFSSSVTAGGDILVPYDTDRFIGARYSGTYYNGLTLNGGTRSTGVVSRSGDASDYIWFGTNAATERMRITNTGNVLIGTTTDAGYKLDVNGTGRFSGALTGTSALFSSYVQGTDIYASYGSQGYIAMRAGGAGAAGFIEIFSNNGTTRLGYIGYSTTNLLYQAENGASHVFQGGAATFSSSVTASNLYTSYTASYSAEFYRNNNSDSRINITNTTTTTGADKGLMLGEIGVDSYFYNYANGNAIFGTASTERMRITSSGNVGIGINSPYSPLDVKATDNSGNRTSPIDVITITAENGNNPYNGFGGSLLFRNRQYAGGPSPGGILNSARIISTINNNSFENAGGNLIFQVTPTGGGALTTSLTLSYTGAATFSSSVTATGNININGSSGTQLYYSYLGTNKYTAEYIQSSDFFAIGRSGIAYDFVLKDGNVGIGTVSPLAKLHLAGELRNSFTSGVGGTNYLNIIDGVSNGFRTIVSSANAITYTFHNGANSAVLNIIESGAATFSSSVTASSLIKSGGTSSQFLMADGSVNTSVLPSGAYLPLTGGTLTGALSGTSATFTSTIDATRFISNVTNSYGLVLNRTAVTTYNGMSLQTAGTAKWFLGMRENLSSNNYIIYSEQTGTDVLTLNVANNVASFAGSVGIGATPVTKLDVRGTSASADATIQIVGNSVSALLLGQNSRGGVIRGQGGNNELSFWTGGSSDGAASGSGTERMRLTLGGNLLIGSTTDNGSGAKLQVTSDVTISSNLSAGGNLLLGASASTIGALNFVQTGSSPIASRITFGTDGTGYKFAIGKNVSSTITDLFTLQDNGAATFSSSVTTGIPSGWSSAGAWKLGTYFATTVALNTAGYITIDINGTLYNLALANPL